MTSQPIRLIMMMLLVLAMPALLTATRQLRADPAKYDEFNRVLSTIKLELPDTSFSTSGLEVAISELECADLSIEDLAIDHSPVSSTMQQMTINVDGVAVTCTFKFDYKWSFFSGSGLGSGVLGRSSTASLDIDFLSTDFGQEPPEVVDMSRCETQVKIDGLSFSNAGLMSGVANMMEDGLRGKIEGELNEVICDELRGWGEQMFLDLLSMLSSGTEGYLVSVENEPLFMEAEGSSEEYINLQKVQALAVNLTGLDLAAIASSFLENDASFDVNAFVNNMLEDGQFEVELPSIMENFEVDMDELLSNTTLSLQSLRINGLDEIEDLDLLKLIGEQTFENSLAFNQLTVDIDMMLQMKQTDEIIQESFTATMDLNNVDINFAAYLGINKSTLGGLKIGSLLHVEDILPCLLSAVDAFQLTTLDVSFDELTTPMLSGFEDEGLEYVISNSMLALYEMYEATLVKALPGFVSTLGRDALSDYAYDAIMENGSCPEAKTSASDNVDFRDLLLPSEEALELNGRGTEPYGDLFRKIFSLVEPMLSSVNDNGLSWVDAILPSKLNVVDGDLVIGDLFHQKMSVDLNGLDADIELGVSDVKVENIDSIGRLSFLQPMMDEPSTLDNMALIGVGDDPLRLSATLLIKGKGDKVEVYNHLRLGLSLANIDMVAHILAEIEETSFFEFPFRDATNINCWMASIVTPILDRYGLRTGDADSGLVLRQLAVVVAEARFDMECILCTSPLLLEMDSFFSSADGIADTTSVANMLFDYATDLLEGPLVQSQLDRMLNDASTKCPHSASYQKNFVAAEYEDLEPIQQEETSISFLFAVAGVVGASLTITFVVYSIAKAITLWRHYRWVNTLSEAQRTELEDMQNDEKRQQKDLNKRTTALICSNEVPIVLRLGMPLIILGNIGLFLSGHLSLGGQVDIHGAVAGQDFLVEGFYDFSVLSSTIEMWEAGAHALAILIAIFSIIWPYTKQLITLTLWICPTSLIGSKKRGSILHWLDVLGKWSMVDIFVLLLTLASFNLNILSPSVSFLPEGIYNIQLMVVPMWGLYSNLTAQLVSQVSSHIIIAYHNRSMNAAARAQVDEWGLSQPARDDPERLCKHHFKLDYKPSGKRAAVRRVVNWILALLLLALASLVIAGSVLPSFNIELFGLVGLLVESGNRFEEAATNYSVFGLTKMIMGQSRFLDTASDYIGLGSLAVLLVVTVFIVPLAQVASLFASWFLPMSSKTREKNELFNEVLSAWQYMEVYVMSIIITAWQISGVSEFMINAYCGSLQSTFTSLAFYGVLKAEDAQCFKVNATVEVASWLLVAASVLLFFVSKFVVSAARQKRQDDNTPMSKRLHTDRWTSTRSWTSVDETLRDEEEGSSSDGSGASARKIRVSPIPPRFTDVFSFATVSRQLLIQTPPQAVFHIGDEVETAVLSNGMKDFVTANTWD